MNEGKKLVSVSGEGYDYNEKEGKFEVKSGKGVKHFSKLSQAISFHEGLNEESALWDVTGMPELLDFKAFQ